jgi:hypothetical protein
MFISAKEKAYLRADVDYLREIIKDLTQRVMQLEGWIPVQANDPTSPDHVFKWVREFNPKTTPKKRGRPVGSKNKGK